MSGTFSLLPQASDLVAAIAGLLAGRADLADCVVVFPGRRPAHFLRKSLFEQLGKSFESPAIYSMDEFAAFLAGSAGADGPEIGELDAAAIMRGLEPGIMGLGPLAGKNSAELDWFLPWAIKAFADFEEIKKELKTPRDLGALDPGLEAGEGTGMYKRATEFSGKFGGFSRLYGAFYAELEKKGLLTPAMKYAAAAAPGAAEKAGLGEKGLVILAGFFQFPKAGQKLVADLFKLSNFRLLAVEGPGLGARYEFLSKSGLIPKIRPYKAPAPDAAKFSFYKAADTHSEVFALGQVIDKENYSEGDVIVLPAVDALFPVVHNILPDFKENNIAIGYPVSHTPVFSLVESLGKLLDRADDGYFIPDYLDLVFHPYVKGTLHGGSPELTRILFQVLQEHFLGRMSRYARLSAIEGDKEFLEAALKRLEHYKDYTAVTAAGISAHLKGIHDAVIRPFEEIKSIGDFAAKVLGLISYVSSSTTAHKHPYWKDFSGRFLSLLDAVSGSRLAGEAFSARPSYFKFFGAAVKGAVYPFEGTPVKGLQVLGLLETRGLKFKRVYFLDANADALNVSGTEDAVLSDFMRGLLKLPTCREREAARKYYFETLLGGAGAVQLFYRDNSKSEKSPFVEELLFRLESAGADREKLENRVFFDLTFKNKEPAAVAKTPWAMKQLENTSFSPSALNHYLACPLRFYYIKVLGLREQEEVSEEISRASIGNIVHRSLELYFQRGGRLGRPFNPGKFEEELAVLLACLEETLGFYHLTDTDKGYGYVMRRQVEKRLKDILHFHIDGLKGFTPLAVEAWLEAGITLPSGKTARLAGKADRIDLRPGPDGAGDKIVIVDYKTGSGAKAPSWHGFDPDGPRADWPRTLRSVQLPAYVLMALTGKIETGPGAADYVTAALAGRGVAEFDACLMLLGRQEIAEESLYKPYRFTSPDVPAVFGKYKSAICTLLEEILDPGLPFAPTRREDDCRHCPFKVMCGRQWVKE